MVRDSQRGRVYAAERFIPEEMWGPYHETVEDCEAYYARITGSRWWASRASPTIVEVMDGRGSARAKANPAYFFNGIGRDAVRRPLACSRIRLPRWSRHDLWMLHELAHVMMPRRAGPGYSGWIRAHHGPAFCRTYLDLVRRWMGPEVAGLLREAFRRKRVRFTVRT